MSRVWPHLPRPTESSLVAGALKKRRPVIVAGPAGIGKTSLTRAVVASSDRPIEWLVGSASTRQTPLAALSTLMPVDGAGDVMRIVTNLSERLIDRRAVLAVEDAGLLDAASAMVVAQLIQSDIHDGVIVMSRSPELDGAEPALTSALSAARAMVVQPTAFSHDDLATIIGQYLGAPMDYADVMRLHSASGGNPLYARHLVAGSVSAGAVHRWEDGTISIAEGFAVSRELEAVVGSAIDAAGPQAIGLLEFLSLLTPLPVSAVADLGFSDVIDDSPDIW
ncbi:hypothetical protein [uncultured Gordonia sp.]|uniref:hypothetical protein n=1 Tax=uncultured Gordonia sp. TaxID=198437 RepID=UPI0026018363|nr:hypothetical protein [uncultured Gordonia sp.]